MIIQSTARTPQPARVQITPTETPRLSVAPATAAIASGLRTPPIGGDWLTEELAGLTDDPASTIGSLRADLTRLTPGGSIAVDLLDGIEAVETGDTAAVLSSAATLFERMDPNAEEFVIPLRIVSSMTTLATATAAKKFDAGANLIIQGTSFFDVHNADGSVALAGQIGAAAGFAKSGAKLYLEWNDDSWNFQDVVVGVEFVGKVGGLLASVGIASTTFRTISEVASGVSTIAKGIDI